MKYRKKPVVIEAIEWNGNMGEIKKFMNYTDEAYTKTDGNRSLFIKTLEGDHEAKIGDMIIKGVQGEFYPCKPDIFKKTYELVEE